jgi:hypothetical protein
VLAAPAVLDARPGRSLLLDVYEAPYVEPPVERDAWLPLGMAVSAEAERPKSTTQHACSFREPVCVHAEPRVSTLALQAALRAAESSFARWVHVLGMPAPRGDSLGEGSDALDLYLVSAARPADTQDASVLLPSETLHVEPLPLAAAPFDEAAVFCVSTAESPPASALAARRCVGEAISAALDGAETPLMKRGFGELLAWEPEPAGPVSHVDALTRFENWQRHPERATVGATGNPVGSAAFLAWLDEAHGVARPLTLPTSVLALSAWKTPALSPEWENEPDTLDVLRRSLEPPLGFAQMFGDFAVARAFMGSRSDGAHGLGFQSTGSAGRVRFDWSLRFSELPRRVACTPVEPTGSVYVWLELDSVPLNATLGFQAEWEPPGTFQWTLVKVAEDGREQQRLRVPYKQRGESAEQRLEDLATSRGVLVVGTSLGGTSANHPFDPDEAPYEARGCTIYLVGL